MTEVMLYWKPLGLNVIQAKSANNSHIEYRVEEIPALAQWSVRQYLTGHHHTTMLKCTRAVSLEAAKQQARAWDASTW
jgi:hypothetical protein